MSTGTADIPIGTVVEVGTTTGATPSTWHTLAEVRSIQPPQASVEAVETTHMGSPSRRREFRPGLTDSGNASGSINHIPGNATDVFMEAWRVAAEVRQVRITYPNGVRYQFGGFLLSYAPNEADVGALMTASFSIRVTGAVTQTDTTP